MSSRETDCRETKRDGKRAESTEFKSTSSACAYVCVCVRTLRVCCIHVDEWEGEWEKMSFETSWWHVATAMNKKKKDERRGMAEKRRWWWDRWKERKRNWRRSKWENRSHNIIYIYTNICIRYRLYGLIIGCRNEKDVKRSKEKGRLKWNAVQPHDEVYMHWIFLSHINIYIDRFFSSSPLSLSTSTMWFLRDVRACERRLAPHRPV